MKLLNLQESYLERNVLCYNLFHLISSQTSAIKPRGIFALIVFLSTGQSVTPTIRTTSHLSREQWPQTKEGSQWSETESSIYRELIVRGIQKYCEIILPLVKGQPFGNGKIPSLRITISYEILISSSQSLFICYVFVLVWSTGVGAEMSNSSFSHPGYFLSKIPCNTSLYNNNNNRAWIHLTSFKNGTLTDSKIISI